MIWIVGILVLWVGYLHWAMVQLLSAIQDYGKHLEIEQRRAHTKRAP